jgi:hypothetical protein
MYARYLYPNRFNAIQFNSIPVPKQRRGMDVDEDMDAKKRQKPPKETSLKKGTVYTKRSK